MVFGVSSGLDIFSCHIGNNRLSWLLPVPVAWGTFSFVPLVVLEIHRGFFLSSALQKLRWAQKVVLQQITSSVLRAWAYVWLRVWFPCGL